MKRTMFTFVFFIGFFVSANSQRSATSSQSISLMLQNTMQLNITPVSNILHQPHVYIKGDPVIRTSVFQVRSNHAWTVTINTAKNIFTGPGKSSSSLLGVHLNGATGFSTLSNTATSIKVGGHRNGIFNIDYSMLPGFNNRTQRIYNVSIIYSQQ
jgi:hypothetical protein